MATWHFLNGPFGLPAKWTATSNVERGSGIKQGTHGFSAMEKKDK